MSAISTAEVTTSAARQDRTAAGRPVLRYGAAASAAAAAVVFGGAALAEALGVTFTDRTGSPIPLVGFAPVAFLLSLLGVALAGLLGRRARHPRRVFTVSAVALLALSLVPVWVSGFGVASAVSLTGLHLTAGAIVIPALRARLAATR